VDFGVECVEAGVILLLQEGGCGWPVEGEYFGEAVELGGKAISDAWGSEVGWEGMLDIFLPAGLDTGIVRLK
jgi:hypothetical protein